VPVSFFQAGMPKTAHAAGGVGTICAPMCHVAAFLWDFNTEYRQLLNAKSDLYRKVIPGDGSKTGERLKEERNHSNIFTPSSYISSNLPLVASLLAIPHPDPFLDSLRSS